MNGFSPCATGLGTLPSDPYKRVNFVHGFVLGADDLTQESTFLANRAESIARDVLGYGTVSGLRVTREMLPGGAGLVVGSGLALSPRGRPIVVTLPQAVVLDEWIDARRNDVAYHVVPGFESPPGDLLRLFVVLGYRQCPTDDKPGPGEPCRTEEPPRFFTRLADDFVLELRFAPPPQMFDDAVRSLQMWLRAIEIVDAPGGTLSLEDFLAALRSAALGVSPPSGTLASPPQPLQVHRSEAAEFLQAALGVWVTELRPLWQTVAPLDDAVLLAEIEVPLIAQPDGRWHAADLSHIVVRTDRRPILLPLRLVQQLTIGEAGTAPFRVEAAGIVTGDTNAATYRAPRFNDLRVVSVADGEVVVTFDGYIQPGASGPFQYVVKALSQTRPAAPVAPVLINLRGFDTNGIRLGVTDAGGAAIAIADLATIEMSIEVTRYVS
jgi:hypothetical protein